MTRNEARARAMGGDRLVRFFDLILAEQRRRWNAPDWRDQPLIEADFTNWEDICIAFGWMFGDVPTSVQS